MEWLWLILSIVGLGLLWLLIMGMDKLTQRLKAHDEARQRDIKRIKARTDAAEEDLIRKQYVKASAQDYIENADFGDQNNPENAAMLAEAMNTLSSEELVQSVARRMFGAPAGTDGITANQSALDHLHAKKVVAKGEGVTPVKVKSSGKSALSKSEQKMLKKIKQGD